MLELSKLTVAGHAVLDRWVFQYRDWWPSLWYDQKIPVPTHTQVYPQPSWKDEDGRRNVRKLTPVALPLPAILLCITLAQERVPSPERAGNKGKVTQQFIDSQRGCFSKEQALSLAKVLPCL